MQLGVPQRRRDACIEHRLEVRPQHIAVSRPLAHLGGVFGVVGHPGVDLGTGGGVQLSIQPGRESGVVGAFGGVGLS